MKKMKVNVYPISEARSKLTTLVDALDQNNSIYLTKNGKMKAVLVSYPDYAGMVNDLKKAYGKTFIDPNLYPKTRDFSNAEIKKWDEEDSIM